MNFKNEDQLQNFIHRVIGGQREVTFPSGKRIDILTHQYAVEVKPKLTRDAIYQAMGQLLAYKRFTGDRQLVIAGITPKDEGSSLSTAKEAKASGIAVWYVDKLDLFINEWHGKYVTAPVVKRKEESLYDRLNTIARNHDAQLHKAKWPKHFQPPEESQQNDGNMPFWVGAGITALAMLSIFGWPGDSTTPIHAFPNGPIITDIPSDSTVSVGQCDLGWVAIQSGDISGWVPVSEFEGQDVCP